MEIRINNRSFRRSDGVRDVMSGADIAALVEIPSANAVIERVSRTTKPREIGRSESVTIEDRQEYLVTREFVMGG